jgi:hypothetical protein
MHRYLTLILILVLFLMIKPSCKEDKGCSIHPEAFRFSLVDSDTGDDLFRQGTYKQEDIAIYYFYGGSRNDLLVNAGENPEDGLLEMVSAQLPMISLTGRSDIFYLRLNQAETDTLFVRVERVARGDCDHHPYTIVKHNGRDIPITEGKNFILYK